MRDDVYRPVAEYNVPKTTPVRVLPPIDPATKPASPDQITAMTRLCDHTA
jgi:hypothetical protein